MRSGFSPLFVIVVIAVLLGSGVATFVAVHKNSSNIKNLPVESPQPTSSPQTTKEKPQSSTSPQPSATSKPITDPTVGWESWQSKYFTTKYPPGWSINFCEADFANLDYEWEITRCKYPYDPTITDSMVNFYFNNVNYQQYYADKISKQPQDSSLKNVEQTNKTVNGFPAVRSSYTENNTKIVKYYINWDQKLFTISYEQGPNRPDKVSEFENIVSTAKLHL